MNEGARQVEALQNLPELVAQKRMTQLKKVEGFKEKKKRKGWSTEEIKNKSSRI